MTSQGKRSYPFNRDLMWKWITEALRFREVILLGKCPIKPLLGEHFFLLLALLVRLHEASTIFDCLKLLTSLLCVHSSNCAIPALNPNSCVWQLISCISEPAWLQVHAHGIQCFLLPPTPGICMHGIVFYAFEFSTKNVLFCMPLPAVVRLLFWACCSRLANVKLLDPADREG